jgi:hypothetical protein
MFDYTANISIFNIPNIGKHWKYISFGSSH